MADDRTNDGANGPGTREPRRISAAAVGWIVVAGVAVAFIVQNSNRTHVQFLIIDRTIRVWVVIVVSMLLGALLGWLLPRVVRRRQRRGARDRQED